MSVKKPSSKAKIEQRAKELLGYEELRPGQEEAINSLLQGRDTLVVQPTGSGKSAIYQLAGELINGATIVVSPLIALQKDQVDSIEESGLASAAAVNSRKPVAEVRRAMGDLKKGQLE